MASDQGESWGSIFIDLEADCSGTDSDKENVAIDTWSSGDEDFIDDASAVQGNTLAVFQTVQKQAGDVKLRKLKRKLQLSPGRSENSAGSPSQGSGSSRSGIKRSLFRTLSPENEAHTPSTQQQVLLGTNSNLMAGSSCSNGSFSLDILRAKNEHAVKCRLFKDVYIAGFTDLTRVFKNDKTTNHQWVAAVFGVHDDFFTGSKPLLANECCYLQATCKPHEKGNIALFLMDFRVAKSRDTVSNLLSRLLNVGLKELMIQPPKVRGTSAAMFWYKSTLCPQTFVSGPLPKWLQSQILISEASDEALKFDFSQMVQYALDNDLTEESQIAFNYAQLADTEANARAWLSLNNQARIVKDVATMVNHYQRAMNKNLTISGYIYKQCQRITGEGSWMNIMRFLNFQGIEPIRWVNALRPWLKGIPKKNCIAIIGPPNTGKSLFTNSLISFFKGRVLSFANSHSHFWLSPLSDTRVALIDDATHSCLKYCDIYLRNFFDGYPVCIDRKHRNAVQIKSPPLLLTTNVDIPNEDKYCYLHSRVMCFYFREQLPFDNEGNPVFTISDADWKFFFERLRGRLELSDQEDEGEDESSSGTFICTARAANGSY
ncbi:E1 [Cervus papillomavirus 2]|uniref:Replication protein E1 n=1 Tax=Cervus elaphus papillomavirus 1 TaxID=1163699 RepID=A0A182BAE8_9PAPI|nr:E1 [Cervus papillomavirus 2]ALX18686.1 E1 [Cervus papillomavirus 2]